MKGLRVYKNEKLCSIKTIDSLFLPAMSEGRSAVMAYPWRAVWRMRPAAENKSDNCTRFLISVPKKRVRHAVNRVRLRRQCREAYRLSRHMLGENMPADVAFIYVGNTIEAPYEVTLRSVHKILKRMADENI